ncbi:hypothetical protein [Nocardiopsis sp. NPDC057823]|uniref:hypothetical protein n=1 Tax=Nocardiopsis sp. NPDC057823 TaxID=3346256 RepID=UPI00366DD1FB
MALGAPYITADELRDYMSVTKERPEESEEFEAAVDSVSREIESHCGRQFNDAGSPSPRTYLADFSGWTYVDDFHTAAGLVVSVDGTEWDPGDYALEPRNGVVNGQPGWPFYKIRPRGRAFRAGRTELTVTARWGWEAVPDPVIQAAKILGAETFTLRTAPLGIVGVDDYGVARVRDSRMAASKLAPYRHRRLLGG